MKVLLSCLALAGGLALPLAAASSPPSNGPVGGSVVADIDLAKPFGAKRGAHFVAIQGWQVDDEMLGKVPGEVRICIAASAAGVCDQPLATNPKPRSTNDGFWEPHYLTEARIVRPLGPQHAPLLLVRTSTLPGMNGDQATYIQLLTYRPATNAFVQVYARLVGRNNNQEVRYVAAGPLAGDIVSAEPAEASPWGYWITVSRPTTAGAYVQVLRYRSATRYGDDNSLRVIDSEMPNIQQRLGLWRAGQPLPLPPGNCPKPHLVRMELWCGEAPRS